VYHDISTYDMKSVQGGVTLRHRPGGQMRIESYRLCSDDYRYWTVAEVQYRDDAWHSPVAWTVTSKVAKNVNDSGYLNTTMAKRSQFEAGSLTQPYTCKWCLLDTVGRLPERFTLIDEYDMICPDQRIQFRGTAAAKTRSGTIEVFCYQHTGIATVPGVFYMDAAGRTLFYLADMQVLVLAEADGQATGYLP
jgi:hypothetical protein